jgi:hypothetical protein
MNARREAQRTYVIGKRGVAANIAKLTGWATTMPDTSFFVCPKPQSAAVNKSGDCPMPSMEILAICAGMLVLVLVLCSRETSF